MHSSLFLRCKTLFFSDSLSFSSPGRIDIYFFFTLTNYFYMGGKTLMLIIDQAPLFGWFFFFFTGETLFSNYSLILWNACSGSDDCQVVVKEERDVVYSKLFILLWEKYVIITLRLKCIKPQEIIYQSRSWTTGFYPELDSWAVAEAGGSMTWHLLSCLLIVKAELQMACSEPPTFPGCLFQELQRYTYNLTFWLLGKVRLEYGARCYCQTLHYWVSPAHRWALFLIIVSLLPTYKDWRVECRFLHD